LYHAVWVTNLVIVPDFDAHLRGQIIDQLLGVAVVAMEGDVAQHNDLVPGGRKRLGNDVGLSRERAKMDAHKGIREAV